MVWRKNKKIRFSELSPDDILLDVHNLPSFNKQQFEGKIERPIQKSALSLLFGFVVVTVCIFVARLGYLQMIVHDFYKTKSEQNNINTIPLFADRGVVYDRNNVELVWNVRDEELGLTKRAYKSQAGYASLLGYVSYPAKDEKGIFWQERTTGKDGIEKQFDVELAGTNGKKLIETDVSGHIVSEGAIVQPVQGKNISLSIDSRLQEALYSGIRTLAENSGYVGGTGLIMDIHTGELYAMTSFPEYDSHIISEGSNTKTIKEYLQSPARPLLNRAIDGVYTPGSIVKPFFALAALQEGIITPDKILYTTGSLSIPNPYNPKLKTVFKDNANHGAVNMAQALAVSSNVYFYSIGGGFGEQKGLGIANLEKYARLFGIGEKTGIDMQGELEGNIPSIAWKAKRFPGDPWRIGDTYNTSIGQYGFQVTPIQMVRAFGAIASRGYLQTPTVLAPDSKPKTERIALNDDAYDAVYEGMRKSVLEGTTQALNNPIVHVAAKSGTAQIKNNTRVNSWAVGFFPIEDPRFAFTVLMEDGPKVSSGAVHAFKGVLEVFAQYPDLLPDIQRPALTE